MREKIILEHTSMENDRERARKEIQKLLHTGYEIKSVQTTGALGGETMFQVELERMENLK